MSGVTFHFCEKLRFGKNFVNIFGRAVRVESDPSQKPKHPSQQVHAISD